METKLNKIMACIDFSDYSQPVLEYARGLAIDAGAGVVICNVINQRDIDMVATASYYSPDQLTIAKDYVKKTHAERMEKIRTMTGDWQDIPLEIRVAAGNPFEKILDTIREEGVDLVIMANKGRSNLSRVLFGSVAEKVFRHSPVPVLSLRPHPHTR